MLSRKVGIPLFAFAVSECVPMKDSSLPRSHLCRSHQFTGKKGGATVFGSKVRVQPEKAVVANASAVREWDSNGTVFGYNEHLGRKFQAGEFGHNDFYPVVIAACQEKVCLSWSMSPSPSWMDGWLNGCMVSDR